MARDLQHKIEYLAQMHEYGELDQEQYESQVKDPVEKFNKIRQRVY